MERRWSRVRTADGEKRGERPDARGRACTPGSPAFDREVVSHESPSGLRVASEEIKRTPAIHRLTVASAESPPALHEYSGELGPVVDDHAP